MRQLLSLIAFSLNLASSPAFCDPSALSDLPPVLPDPSLATSIRFPPSLTTAGVAQVGPSPAATGRPYTPCTPANPCAMATPAADRVAPARPNWQANN